MHTFPKIFPSLLPTIVDEEGRHLRVSSRRKLMGVIHKLIEEQSCLKRGHRASEMRAGVINALRNIIGAKVSAPDEFGEEFILLYYQFPVVPDHYYGLIADAFSLYFDERYDVCYADRFAPIAEVRIQFDESFRVVRKYFVEVPGLEYLSSWSVSCDKYSLDCGIFEHDHIDEIYDFLHSVTEDGFSLCRMDVEGLCGVYFRTPDDAVQFKLRFG